MKSIVIVGKGTSVLNSTREFIDQHDKICIVNEVIYSPKYTSYISNRADYQFINSTANYYKKETFDTLGITKIFSKNYFLLSIMIGIILNVSLRRLACLLLLQVC